MENVIIQKKDNKKTQKMVSYYVSLLIIGVLIGAIVWTMIRLEINVESSYFTNGVISLIGLLFSAILFISCIAGNFGWNLKKNLLFIWILLSISLEFFCIGVACSMENKIEFNTHITGITYTYYISFILSSFVFLLYILQFFQEKEKYKKFTIFYLILTLSYMVVIGINPFTGILFNVENGTLVLKNNDIISSSYNIFCDLMFFFLIITAKIKGSFKRAFLTYSLFPIFIMILNIILGVVFKVEAPINLQVLSQLIPVYIIFVMLYIEDKSEYEKQKADNTEMKTAIMISQIQPHFIYNTLATISGLCREEGAMKTREVVNKFADYLRTNIDSLEFHQLVPFEKELEHVKTYLWIEKMRFGDDIKVEYDIEFSDFELPTLIIQPLVENAVKHGICKKEDGGTIKIVSRREENYIIIQVIDDGIGYDVDQKLNDGRTHVGISNIKSRLELLNKGTLEISSEVGVGTTATVKIFYNVGGGYY